MESAAFRRVGRARDVTLEHDALAGSSRAWDWHGGAERFGVGVEGTSEDLAPWCQLDHFAEIHDADAGTDILDHA
jgi:hypothetical protein